MISEPILKTAHSAADEEITSVAKPTRVWVEIGSDGPPVPTELVEDLTAVLAAHGYLVQ